MCGLIRCLGLGGVTGVTVRVFMVQVTTATFAAHLCIDDNGLIFGSAIPEVAKLTSVKRQRGILQSRSVYEQLTCLSQFSALYLPRLVQAWKDNSGALNSHTCMLNYISSNGILYFSRFMRLPEAQGMAALQVARMATSDFPGSYDEDDLAEIGQFLSTLLMFQGDAAVAAHDKALVVRKLRTLLRRQAVPPRDTLIRCFDYLSGDSVSIMMHGQIRQQVEEDLCKCGVEECRATTQNADDNMMQCARCKVAVYCGVVHQKQAWPGHKPTCFPPTF